MMSAVPESRRARRDATGSTDPSTKKNRRRKILAIASGGIVLGVGITASLAAWTDSEWIIGNGGADGAAISTSQFNVVQSTNGTDWSDHESEADPNAILFETNADALAPGSIVYAGVYLKTADDSLAGSVTLQSATLPDGADTTLFGALEARVAVEEDPTSPPVCNASFFTDDNVIFDDNLSAQHPASGPQDLAADGASTAFYCFELELPDIPENRANKALQDKSVTPLWEFAAVSD